MGFVTQATRLIVSLVGGFAAAWLLFLVGHIRFLQPGLLILLCMVGVWFLLPRLFPVFKTQPKTENTGPITLDVNGQSFQATHHTKNVAINAATSQVWFRDTKGKEWVLDAADIRKWKHEWTDRASPYRMIAHDDNYLVITTNNLDHPTHRVSMGGHAKHELAKEWHARLTAMLNA